MKIWARRKISENERRLMHEMRDNGSFQNQHEKNKRHDLAICIATSLEDKLEIKTEKEGFEMTDSTILYVLTEKDWNEIREHLFEIKKLSGYCDQTAECHIESYLGKIQEIIIE